MNVRGGSEPLGAVRTLFRFGALGGMDDAALLGLLLGDDRDAGEAAFEVLVRRHGPTVLRVCRRILGREHDAQDAFQATFLALVRGAAGIRRRESLAGWLHGAALRQARRARLEAARRRDRERRGGVVDLARADTVVDPDRDALLEEVARLPEPYRRPVVLCYLEGRSVEEAAGELGCPRGTVLSRLARARDRLRPALERRGLAPAVWLARGIDPGAAPRSLPKGLVAATLAAARGQPVTQSAGPGMVAALARCGLVAALVLVGRMVAPSPPPVAPPPRVPFVPLPVLAEALPPAPARPAPLVGPRGVALEAPGLTWVNPQAVALHPDGDLLVAGLGHGDATGRGVRGAVVKLDLRGFVDWNFGVRGLALTAAGPSGAGAGQVHEVDRCHLLVQPDGRIVVAAPATAAGGGPGEEIAVQRFLPDGRPDASFGNGGSARIRLVRPGPDGPEPFPFATPTGLALAPDGGLIVAGPASAEFVGDAVFALIRLAPDGRLDPGFGHGGWVATGFTGRRAVEGPARPEAVIVEPGGRIVAVGGVEDPASGCGDLVVAAYDARGRLDPGFGEGGIIRLDVGRDLFGRSATDDRAQAVALGRDGALVVAGSTGFRPFQDRRVFLARFRPDGHLDHTFGDGGVQLADDGPLESAQAIALGPDGEIHLVGMTDRYLGAFQARFTPDGAPDRTFGVDGRRMFEEPGLRGLNGLAVLPDGSVVSCGMRERFMYGDAFLVRHPPR